MKEGNRRVRIDLRYIYRAESVRFQGMGHMKVISIIILLNIYLMCLGKK